MASDSTAVTRQLEWEAALRPRTVAAGVAAGVLMLGGALYSSAGLKPPHVGVVQGLAPALRGIADPRVDPRSAGIAFTAHHSARIIASSLVSAIGIALISLVLLYLYSAVKARRPELPNIVRPLAIAGPILVALAGVVTAIVFSINSHHYINGVSRTRQAADHVFSSSGAVIAQVVGLLGALSLGFAFIMLGLNAMRVGLLTRFLGILAIISGVLFVIPIFGAGLPVVQAFWLVALAFVLSGRNPTGLPPAWAAGEAVPWPTQQQQREARLQASRQREAAQEPAPEPVAPPQAQSQRRKRKRR
jgi:F0F1-type ATP synthase membrane subunit c/vacuolar-type H+-ATPase subunit K